jgi:hypothetical protein
VSASLADTNVTTELTRITHRRGAEIAEKFIVMLELW